MYALSIKPVTPTTTHYAHYSRYLIGYGSPPQHSDTTA